MKKEQLDSIKTIFAHADLTSKSFDLRQIFSSLDIDESVAPVREWAATRGVKDAAFDQAHRTWRIVKSLGSVPKHVVEFVEHYVSRNGIAAQFNGLLNAPKNGIVANHPDIESLTRDLRLLSRKLSLGFKNDAIADGVSAWLSAEKHKRLNSAFVSIVATSPVNADLEWRALADAIGDPAKQSANYVVRVLQTAIWQVKRRLADDPDYPVQDHLMTILSGPQRAGKTEATQAFFSPIADLVAPTNFAEVTDKTNFDLWSYPVLFLDEMEAADRSDVEAIKNAITRPIKSARILYTGMTGTIRVRSTLWGCTNGTLGDKIADTTGLRRFGPISVKHSPTPANVAAGLPVMDWATINGTDFTLLWQSVDHRAAHPLQSDPQSLAEWTQIVEGERQMDSVEAWLRQIEREFVHIVPVKKHRTGELYGYGDGKGYRDWCIRNGFAPVSMLKFGKRLQSLHQQPWYPFEAPKQAKSGTVHVLKDLIRDAADLTANDGRAVTSAAA
jgi:Virulence-associated protein E